MFRLICSSLLLLAGFSSNAFAALTYSLTFSDSNVSIGTGQTVTLGVLFNEISNDFPNDTFRLGLNAGEGGLLNANFGINVTGPGGNAITSAAGNSAFDVGPVVDLGPPTTIVQSVDIFTDSVFATDFGATRSVQVGTVTITGSNLVGDVNTFSLFDLNTNFVDFTIDDLTLDGFDADGVMSFGSVTVTAVPEPSSLVLLGIAGLIGGNRLRRLRKVSEPKNVSPTTAS